MSDRSLDELCTLIVDSEHKTAPKDPDGAYPLVRTTDLGRARVTLRTAQRVNSDAYRLWTRRARPQPGDVVLAREAPVGGVACVPADTSPVLGQRTVLLRPNAEHLDGAFLGFRLAAPDMQGRVQEMATGSTVPHLNMSDIRALTVPGLPPVQTQRRVACALAQFDDLVAINERRLELLERLAVSLHREWFSGELRSGWRKDSLFDVADVGFGFSFKSAGFSEAGPNPVIRIRDVPRGFTATYSHETPGDRYRVDDTDVLIGMDGEFHMRQWADGPAWLNQRVARIRPKPGLSAGHLLEALRAPIAALNESIVGTTVAHLGKRHLEEIRLPMPPPDLLEPMTRAFDSISASRLTLTKQNRRLVATRDLLLPRLVTGRLDISEIDLGDLLEEAAA